MNLRNFHIGLEFFAGAGFRWRCTDTGSRTVLAIRLIGRTPDWLVGPPYIVDEVVFDEREMEHCYLTQEDAILAAKHEHESRLLERSAWNHVRSRIRKGDRRVSQSKGAPLRSVPC